MAQNLVFLFLNLENDHSSDDAHNCLKSDQDDLLKSLHFALRIPVIPKRTKLDEIQLTSLVRAFLKLFGGKMDCRQHRYAKDYTPSENADLYALLFNIKDETVWKFRFRRNVQNTLKVSSIL